MLGIHQEGMGEGGMLGIHQGGYGGREAWWVYTRVGMVGVHLPGICTPVLPWVYHRPSYCSWSYSAVSTSTCGAGRRGPGLNEEDSYSHEAHRGSQAPISVRDVIPFCAELLLLSRR